MDTRSGEIAFVGQSGHDRRKNEPPDEHETEKARDTRNPLAAGRQATNHPTPRRKQ